MRKFAALALAALSLLMAGTTCPTTPNRLRFADEEEPGIWEYLEDSGCDLSSTEAEKYVECLYGLYEEYSGDASLHETECDDEYAAIPGCSANGSPSGGELLPASGTLVASYAYGSDVCPYSTTVTIDLATRAFYYEVSGECDYQPARMHDSAVSTGTLYADGWFEGDLLHSITKTCQPGLTCGETSLQGSSATSRLVAFVDVMASAIYTCNYGPDDPRADGWDIETFRQCQDPGGVACCPTPARETIGFSISP